MKFISTASLFLFLVTALVTTSASRNPKRFRRAVDPNALGDLVAQQAETIEQLQARLDSLETEVTSLRAIHENAVAFNVRLTTTNDQPFTDADTLIFGRVDLNAGNGYDPQTGVFTAPVPGLYIFSLHIAHTPPGRLHVNIFKNGSVVAEAEASGDDTYRDRSSSSVYMRLAKGDSIYVKRNPDSTATNIQGYYRTSFSGMLVVPE